VLINIALWRRARGRARALLTLDAFLPLFCIFGALDVNFEYAVGRADGETGRANRVIGGGHLFELCECKRTSWRFLARYDATEFGEDLFQHTRRPRNRYILHENCVRPPSKNRRSRESGGAEEAVSLGERGGWGLEGPHMRVECVVVH
jgi:hypothetical protein